MKSTCFLGIVTVFITFGLFLCCDGATVQFFTEVNFKGELYQTSSSSNCQQIPSGVTVNWSVKTTGCIVVFNNNNCTADHGDPRGFVVRGVNSYLHPLRNSYRDCTDMERGPQVNLDYYAEVGRNGQKVEYRDICACTNLPYFNSNSQSLNTYGNYFTFYDEQDCQGFRTSTSNFARFYYNTISQQRSVIPLVIPSHCSQTVYLTAKILKLEPFSNSANLKNTKQEASTAPTKTFLNNSTKPIERNFEIPKNISNTAEIQLSELLRQMNAIRLENTTAFRLFAESTLPFVKSMEDQIRNRLTPAFQSHNQSSLTDIKIITVEKQAPKNLTIPPCTMCELTFFEEILENAEIDYHIHLSVTGKRGEVKVSVDGFRKSLTGLANLTIADDYTVLGETTGKLKVENWSNLIINVTMTPIPECRKNYFILTAQVVKIEPINSYPKLEDSTQKILMSNKQIFINNYTTSQVKNFQVEKEIMDDAQFVFAKELNKAYSIKFGDDVQVPFEPLIGFLTSSLNDLNSALSFSLRNDSNLEEPYKFAVESHKTLRVQENVNVGPCTKYEISSFIEMAKNVEVEYRVLLKVTGKLGLEPVEAGEIQENLDGLAFLNNQDNFTVLSVTTAKLKLNYGFSSGVSAVGSPIPECRSRLIKLSVSIVGLDRVTPIIHETITLRRISIGPKQIYINNGTMHQEENYEASKEMIETAEISFPKEFASVISTRVDEEIKTELEKAIPFLPKVWTKLTGGLFSIQSQFNDNTSFRVKNKNEFRVQKIVAVPPCTRYEVESFIEMTENAEVNYRAVIEITGRLGMEKVLAEEIRGHLKEVEFLREKDNFTVIAEANMKLKLNYGASSGVITEGKQLLKCLAIQAEFLGNCKFVCSS